MKRHRLKINADGASVVSEVDLTPQEEAEFNAQSETDRLYNQLAAPILEERKANKAAIAQAKELAKNWRTLTVAEKAQVEEARALDFAEEKGLPKDLVKRSTQLYYNVPSKNLSWALVHGCGMRSCKAMLFQQGPGFVQVSDTPDYPVVVMRRDPADRYIYAMKGYRLRLPKNPERDFLFGMQTYWVPTADIEIAWDFQAFADLFGSTVVHTGQTREPHLVASLPSDFATKYADDIAMWERVST